MHDYKAQTHCSLFFAMQSVLCKTLVIFCIVCFTLACTDDSSDENTTTGGTGGEAMAGTNTTGMGMTAGSQAGSQAGDNNSMMSMGCASDADCSENQACNLTTQTCQSRCSEDQGCESGQLCIDMLCQATPSCTENSCPNDLLCDCNNTCVRPSGAMCTTPLQCSTQEYCDECEKQCKPKIAPCASCQNSDACERRDDICSDLGGESVCLRACTGQGTCDNLGPGYTCQAVNGEEGTYCVPNAGSCSALTGCDADQDCMAGEYCNDRQQCQPGCIDDTSCAGGLLCQGLRCGPACMSDADCQNGAECEGIRP